MRDPALFPVNDPSRPGEVRRAAVNLAAALDFPEEAQGRVALVATEAATNLFKHATGGEVVLRSLSASEGLGIEVLAFDRGPGMADLARCFRDGFSTSGTAGTGLGALRRLPDMFDISTAPPFGTVLVARIHPAPLVDPRPPAEFGAVCLPVAGEEVCGDAWAVAATPERTLVFVADGLGHGPLAATASGAAVRVFRDAKTFDPVEQLQAIHAALRPTRGAAAALAVIDHTVGVLRYAGVGNIAGAIVAPHARQGLVSLAGTLGHEARRFQAFEYPWSLGALLVMHSDGIGSNWDLGRYPGLIGRHPALVAGALFRDSRRERDDATVVAVRSVEGAR